MTYNANRHCFTEKRLNAAKLGLAQHFFKETVAFIFSACTRAEKLTPHLHYLRDLCDLLFKFLSGFLHFPISGEVFLALH
jgi:hypothetical protein